MGKPLALVLCAQFALAQPPIRGFPDSDLRAERAREEELLAIPSAQRIATMIERMSAAPHHAGSPGSKAVAEYALGLFREWGLDARIETFEAPLPYPTTRVLDLISPVKYHAQLKEPAIAEDPGTTEAGQLPTFNAYSGSGDVTAPLVYVNYGVPEDYDYLRKLGIDVKGRIVIARYGKSWRGVKPKVAFEHGAVGCLIYSDPREDGYFQGDEYPWGPFRPAQGVQRGSVMDMALATGDPLSGQSRAEAKGLMKGPVLPISYADALPLLENIQGPVAPDEWRGALPLTYHLGPGPAAVHLKLDFDWAARPIYNVIATLPGWESPDEWVLYGNHHDAWVNGASDPGSGAAALLEAARSFAVLAKQGWRPRRTILFALWDGEEFGLIGSTGWAEKHADELRRKAVAYLNSDTNSRGPFMAGGSPALERFMSEVLRDSSDPSSGKSMSPRKFRLEPLGAGSDYVPFLDHLGVASLNLGFGGGEAAGVYHSIYDTFAWYKKFGDSDFLYGKALAQVTATSLLRLAEAPVVPFEFESLSRAARQYTEEIQKQTAGRVPLDRVLAELERISATSHVYETELANFLSHHTQADAARRKQLNEVLFRTERALTLAEGLPQRPWYRHQITAPGLYTGYGAKTLPGVREAVEGGHWEEASQQAQALARALREFNGGIEEAVRLLDRPAGSR